MVSTATMADTQVIAPVKKSGYLPGLDVLRGLAILMVLASHGLSVLVAPAQNASRVFRYIAYTCSWGTEGVYLFFVLSGFLITGILVDGRGKSSYFGDFYYKRVLRIVPAYLLLLAVLRFTHWIGSRYMVVCLLYLANVCSLFHIKPEYGPLWSLSVEEQFYLVWPIVVKKLTNRALLITSACLVGCGVLVRFLLMEAGGKLADWSHKTWGVADFFAAGAVIALCFRTPRWKDALRRAATPLMVLGLLGCVALLFEPTVGPGALQNLLDSVWPEPALLLWTGAVILSIFFSRMASFPVSRPLVFLARISYGLYLYHQFIFTLIERHWHEPQGTPNRVCASLVARFAVESAASILVAWISRETLEEFFLRLKPKHRQTSTVPEAVLPQEQYS